MTEKATQADLHEQEEKEETASCECPIRELFDHVESSFCESFGVFRQTRVEFLKALRTLIDKQIDHLEGKKEKGKKKTRVRKIVVED